MPSNIATTDHPPVVQQLLTDVLFAPLRAILATADISRKCICFDDITFAILSVMRCLQNSKTGRDFLQTHAIPEIPKLTRGNYFASLKSPRRLAMMRNLARRDRVPDKLKRAWINPAQPNLAWPEAILDRKRAVCGPLETRTSNIERRTSNIEPKKRMLRTELRPGTLSIGARAGRPCAS